MIGVLPMAYKSLLGYVIAFTSAIVIYLAVYKYTEKKWIDSDFNQRDRKWIILQWLSTGFLWSQWLIQDLANIYVYLPRTLSLSSLIFSLTVVLGLLGYIFYARGGAIQKIVTSKTNTNDTNTSRLAI